MIDLPWNTGPEPRPIAERIAGRVAKRIADGEIEPGAILTEVEVAAEHDASRTPAREAMLRLERWGLVRLVPKKGAVVTNPSARERRELLAVRSMFEGNAATYLATAGDDRARLLAVLDENLAAQSAALADPPAFAELDYAFHLAIVGHDDNRVVAEISRMLAPRMFRLTRLAGATSDLARLRDEHVALAAAIREQDPERFRRLIADHLDAGHSGYAVAE
ncbi:GntR family transcriptional regulator [Microbacterium sp. gxy059]|uniref:GntR family transcriptional regulator n=1 Tax=Microbacterium sp. gxy059 TaxID=2957199 RepID=UPI003D974CDA